MDALKHHLGLKGGKDFLHRGIVVRAAPGARSNSGQDPPLSACHAAGKVPSHCVVTEFKDVEALKSAAKKAGELFGYTRMWSIHPDQIRPIIDAFAPDASAVAHAGRVIHAAIGADWAPVAIDNQLHDRASYRYYWHVIERAHATGVAIPTELQQFF